jgi:PAS domain S-box-containing protein
MENGKEIILIVDDKPANIYAVEKLLEKEDRILLSATDGKTCLKMALERDIDLIILDVQMPEMDGFEVAQILKSNKRTKEIPIIFASAEKKERQSVMKGFEEGAMDYLSKPLDPELTIAKVSVLLKLQRQKKELMEKNLSLEKSALLINNSADIIGILHPATLLFEEVNSAFTATLGYSLEEAKRRPITTFLGEEHQAFVRSITNEKNELLSFETNVYTNDGTEKWLQWRVTVKDGRWFVNARDITRQRLADEQIRQLNDDLQKNLAQLEITNKELESFSYSVSHDLRAPLRALDGYSKMLEDEYIGKLDEEGVRLFGIIRRNAWKMGKLIDDLLEFSKLGRKEVIKSEVNVERLVKTAMEDIGETVRHQAKITVNPLLPVYADYSLLSYVWTNLLSNAIKYSSKKPDPQIEIGCVDEGSEIVYFIRDNGVGFSMDYVDKLFGVFQRLHKATEFEGTGVGLAIVQRIVTKHGGRVWAEGKPNEGAVFYFSLPREEEMKDYSAKPVTMR